VILACVPLISRARIAINSRSPLGAHKFEARTATHSRHRRPPGLPGGRTSHRRSRAGEGDGLSAALLRCDFRRDLTFPLPGAGGPRFKGP